MRKHPTIAEPIPFRFFKNRRKDVVAVTLQAFTPPGKDPINVVDVRLFAMNRDGANVATPKGLAMSVNRLPDLAKAINQALAKANELGLLDGSDEE